MKFLIIIGMMSVALIGLSYLLETEKNENVIEIDGHFYNREVIK